MSPEHLAAVSTIISHADCPDGIASAMILKDALPKARLQFIQHNTPEQRALKAEPGMLFCDIAPPEERADAFVKAGALVLDHHKGAREVVAAFAERGVFANEKTQPGISGARLAYDEVWRVLRGEDDAKLLRFATLAGIRDTWQKHHPDWDSACAQSTALLFYGYEALAGQASLSEEQLAVGELLMAKRLASASQIASGKLLRLTDSIAVYNDRDRLLSDVAEAAFNIDPALQVVCGFFYKVNSNGHMLMVASLRARKGGVDVAALAKKNGGGGHSAAAGFGLALDETSQDPIAELRKRLC